MAMKKVFLLTSIVLRLIKKSPINLRSCSYKEPGKNVQIEQLETSGILYTNKENYISS